MSGPAGEVGQALTPSQRRALGSAVRFLSVCNRIQLAAPVCRAYRLFCLNWQMARAAGLQPPTLPLFVAVNYMSGTFAVEGRKIRLK